MNLLLNRLYDNSKDTIGILYYLKEKELKYVYTLEDEYREVKVFKETRIPAGQYELEQVTDTQFVEKYRTHANLGVRELTKKYGMLRLKNVPNFTGIYMHPGIMEEHTAGCILMANNVNNNSIEKGLMSGSYGAYVDLASAVFMEMLKGVKVFITIMDMDRDIRKQFNA